MIVRMTDCARGTLLDEPEWMRRFCRTGTAMDLFSAIALSDEKYCSATAMIRKSAAVTHELVLEEVD